MSEVEWTIIYAPVGAGNPPKVAVYKGATAAEAVREFSAYYGGVVDVFPPNVYFVFEGNPKAVDGWTDFWGEPRDA